MSKSDGGPAFPTDQTRCLHKTPSVSGGMSLRDWFAGTSGREALFVLETTGGEWLRFGEDNAVNQLAKMKLKIADAMLKEREGSEMDLYLNEQIKCPHCGRVETVEGYDVLGADDGFVFCTSCHGMFLLAAAEAAGGNDEQPETASRADNGQP